MTNEYEITFPRAAAMIEQERRSVVEVNRCVRAAMNEAFTSGAVAAFVAEEEEFRWWEEQCSVQLDKLLSAINTMGNAREWQMSLLYRALTLVERREVSPSYLPYQVEFTKNTRA